MTLFFGTILEKQVLLASDSMWYDGEKKRKDPFKIERVNNSTFLVSGGNIFASDGITKIVRDLCTRPINLWELEGKRGRDISRLALLFWKKEIIGNPEIVAYWEKTGRLLSVNILFGGIDEGGRPFLANLFDTGNFEIQVHTRAGVSVISPNSPEVVEGVRGRIRKYLTVAIGKSEVEQMELAKKMLPGIFEYVSLKDEFVSVEGNGLFIHRSRIESFTFPENEKNDLAEQREIREIVEVIEKRMRSDFLCLRGLFRWPTGREDRK